jgi:hypothetical protein
MLNLKGNCHFHFAKSSLFGLLIAITSQTFPLSNEVSFYRNRKIFDKIFTDSSIFFCHLLIQGLFCNHVLTEKRAYILRVDEIDMQT